MGMRLPLRAVTCACFLISVLVALFAGPVKGQSFGEVLIPPGSQWKYWDHGAIPDSFWMVGPYNDSQWSSGLAQLGYGDGDEATIVSYGPDPDTKYIPPYLRRAFVANN